MTLNSDQKSPRKPDWIRSQWPCNPEIRALKNQLRKNHLATVCEAAACPNLGECFNSGTATFLIMGDVCTRNCRFCNVAHGTPKILDSKEPILLAQTIRNMKLKYAVITSVTRDDLPDGGAKHFTACIRNIRAINPNIKIEILTPDFRYCMDQALVILGAALPNVFNHNIETAPSLYSKVRPQADYQTSLTLLKKHRELYPTVPTKSGMMLGLGETNQEIEQVLVDLRDHHVDILTLGQYLQPTKHHLPVERYVTPAEFVAFATLATKMGFKRVTSAPLARSSYHASQ